MFTRKLSLAVSLLLMGAIASCVSGKATSPSDIYLSNEKTSVKHDMQYAVKKDTRNYTVLLSGDSLSVGLEKAIKKSNKYSTEFKFINSGVVSSGLCNQKFYDWILKMDQLIDKYNPSIVTISLGTNDDQTLNNSGIVARYGSEKWGNGYAYFVEKIILTAQKRGAQVIWLLAPPMHDPILNEKLYHINSIISNKCEEYNVPIYDMGKLLSLENRQYTQYKDNVKIRAKDGVHITYDGNIIILEELIPFIKSKIK